MPTMIVGFGSRLSNIDALGDVVEVLGRAVMAGPATSAS